MLLHGFPILLFAAGVLAAQDGAPRPAEPARKAPAEAAAKSDAPKLMEYTVATGTKIPLVLLNSISTKHSAPGDTVYLQTAFPVILKGRIVIPIGSYVTGTVTEVKRPSRAKGPSELFIRFDTLTLPNGVTRHFNATVGGLDGTVDAKVDRTEGKISGDSNKGRDAATVAATAGMGAEVGGIAGAATSHPVTGIGIGAAAGAAAGLIGIMTAHSPDATLPKGTTVEMVLDRPISFSEIELN